MGELMRISVIGTGNMGGAIASALYESEYEVAVYDKATEKAEKLAEEHEGMTVLSSIEDASGSDAIIIAVKPQVLPSLYLNPEGYKKPYILSLDGITVKVDLKSLTSDTIIIEKVQIDKPVVTYEMLSLTQNNIKQLQENIKHFTDSGKSASADAKEAQPAEETKEGGKKVIIKSLTVNNGELQAAANIAGNSPDISVKLPTIQMNNIGAAKNGDSITQTITKIFNQILSTASATAVSSNLSNLKDVATENLNNVVGGVKDRVKSIGIFGK